MNIKAFEAKIENGQIKLPVNIHLPENTKVYVVVPEEEVVEVHYLASPRLADPKQISDFVMEVVEQQ